MSKSGISSFIITFLFIVTPAVAEVLSSDNDTSDLVLYEYKEAFFDIPFPIDTLITASEFRFTSFKTKTTCIYFDHGPFQCYFFCEPGHSYTIQLPEPYHIDARWKENPYYQKIPVHVQVNPDFSTHITSNINDSIRLFDEQYNPFLAELVQFYYKPEIAKVRLDSFAREYFDQEREEDSGYFNQYKRYKKGILEFHINQHNLDTLINEYLLGKPIRFEIPSYRDFFSLVLGNYFDYLQKTKGYENIYSEFASTSIRELTKYLKMNPLLSNDTILETILLKEGYNTYYNETIPKDVLLSLIDSLSTKSTIESTKATALVLKKQFTFLRNGYQVPYFSAYDIHGRFVESGKPAEKLILLGFCDLDQMQCLRELEHLKYIQARHERFLESILVLKYSSKKQLDDFGKNAPGSMHIVNWSEYPKPAKIYEIMALPSFFLIDRNGIMLRNPAPNPSKNFEYELFKILRAKGEI